MKDKKFETEIKIDFDISDVSNKLLRHLKKTTDCLTHIYHTIDKTDSNFNKVLPTDNLPIVINDRKPKITINEQKNDSLSWVLTKSFEDIINGLIISFKEAYKYLKTLALSQNTEQIWTLDEFEKELLKIEKNNAKFHFPEFIAEIEKLLKQPIPFKKEILSFNQIRNCLVHRNGVVEEKDIKHSPTSNLRLKWILLELSTTKDGKEKKINYELRKDGIIVDNLFFKTINHEKTFKLKDKIILDIDDFNGISYTCTIFAIKLFELMPRPQ